MAEFKDEQSGGVRAEARAVVVAGSSGSMNQCLNNAFKAACLMGDSEVSGLRANAVLSNQTSNKLTELSLEVSQRGRGSPDLYAQSLQSAVNQMGQYIGTNTLSEKMCGSASSLISLLHILRGMSGVESELATGSSATSFVVEEQPSGCCRDLAFLQGEGDSWPPQEQHLAEAEADLLEPFRIENASDVEARHLFSTIPKNVRYSRLKKKYVAKVRLPVLGGRSSSRGGEVSLAEGSLAQCCFAMEIHQAFLTIIYQRAKKRDERSMSKLSRRTYKGERPITQAETRSSYKIMPAAGCTKEYAPEVHPEAMALANCSTAKKLVLIHLSELNAEVSKQMEAIPREGRAINSNNKEEFLRHSAAASSAYFKFRAAVAHFIRARHIAQCRNSGIEIPPEFDEEIRGGGGEGGAAFSVPRRASAAQEESMMEVDMAELRRNEEGIAAAAAAAAATAVTTTTAADQENGSYSLFTSILFGKIRRPFRIKFSQVLRIVNEHSTAAGKGSFEEAEASSFLSRALQERGGLYSLQGEYLTGS
jgi:hypothetical protein